jgi:hypothetical protein
MKYRASVEDWEGECLAILLGVFVILSAAKNLRISDEILRCAQKDRLPGYFATPEGEIEVEKSV